MDNVFKQLISKIPIREFVKFCIVGSSGVFVDMAILWLLASEHGLGWNLSLSKCIAAETALINNFIWNNYWTFKERRGNRDSVNILIKRFLKFNLICGIGIGLGVILINLFYVVLKFNLIISNLGAIFIVTLWNFCLNARYNWSKIKADEPPQKDRLGNVSL